MNDKTLEAIIAERDERLTELIRVLDDVEALERPFDLNHWFGGAPYDCGTAACAIGWACRDPWFQERGLFASEFSRAPELRPEDPNELMSYGFTAVCDFFHLEDHAAVMLITSRPDHYTPAHVKAVARRLIGDQRRLASFT